jgi:replicative DNA helicase
VKQAHPSNGGGSHVSRVQRAEPPPLCDLESERTFLCSCITKYPELILESGLAAHDFYSGANETVFAALLHLVANGIEVSDLTLQSRLRDAGLLGSVGGGEYIESLVAVIPDRKHDFIRLRRLARQRELQQIGRSLGAAGGDEFHSLCLRFGAKQREVDALVGERQAPPYMLLGEFFEREVRPIGERLSMGFASLDASMRGGLPPRQLIALLGAPGSRKTSLATYWADLWERAGYAVVFLAGDEAGSKIAIRLGQLAGVSRDGIEAEGDEGDASRACAVAQLRGRRIVLLDPRVMQGTTTIETAERVLLHLAGDRPRVLMIDSLQSVFTEASFTAADERERITLGINLCRGIADRGAIVVAISEMSRAGYRTGDRSSDVSVLAAAKESGRVEYAADLLMGARPVLEEPLLMDLEIGKSRPGDKLELRLKFDRDRASFAETAAPLRDQVQGQAQRRLDKGKERVRAVLQEHHDLHSSREVLAHCDGTRWVNLEAFNEMLKHGEVVRVGKAFRTVVGT